MKVNDSGMPGELYWNSLFDIKGITGWLQLENCHDTIVEVGCGYGTFTVPVAQTIDSNIIAYDIEQEMINITERNLLRAKVKNYKLILKDIVENGSGLETGTCGMVLLFNILHFNERKVMLKEASRILKPKGILAVIHWRKDIPTPRGPSLDIRPGAVDIIEDSKEFNFSVLENPRILEPFHWGVKLVKGD